jgi:hypothetical protein
MTWGAADAGAAEAGRTFVVIEGEDVSWALAAETVERIVPERDWEGATPLELSSADDGWEAGESRVLLTRGEVPILGRGKIGIFTADENAILPLPPILRDVASHVVFREKTTPLLVVDVSALTRRAP